MNDNISATISTYAFLWYGLRVSQETAAELASYLSDYSDVSIETVLLDHINNFIPEDQRDPYLHRHRYNRIAHNQLNNYHLQFKKHELTKSKLLSNNGRKVADRNFRRNRCKQCRRTK